MPSLFLEPLRAGPANPAQLFREFVGPSRHDLTVAFPGSGEDEPDSLEAFDGWWDGVGLAVYDSPDAALEVEQWLDERLGRSRLLPPNARPWVVEPTRVTHARKLGVGNALWWPASWLEARHLFLPAAQAVVRLPGSADAGLVGAVSAMARVAVSMGADVYLLDPFAGREGSAPTLRAALVDPMIAAGFGRPGCHSRFVVVHADDAPRGLPAFGNTNQHSRQDLDHDRFLVVVRPATVTGPTRDAALVCAMFLGQGLQTLERSVRRVSLYGRLGRGAKGALARRLGRWLVAGQPR